MSEATEEPETDEEETPEPPPKRPDPHPALGREVVYWPERHKTEPKAAPVRMPLIAKVVHVFPPAKRKKDAPEPQQPPPPDVTLAVFTRHGVQMFDRVSYGPNPGQWSEA